MKSVSNSVKICLIAFGASVVLGIAAYFMVKVKED